MKNFSVLFAIIMGLSMTIAYAEIQSPIYTDDIGRSHFLGKGGYSTVRQINMQGMEANAVNDAVKYHSQQKAADVVKTEKVQEDVEKTVTDITSVIKETSNDVPISNRGKVSITPEERKLDASAPFGMGMTNINSGVNESKTLYTDDIGRLHFFGRANQIRE